MVPCQIPHTDNIHAQSYSDHFNGKCHLTAITGATILVIGHWAKLILTWWRHQMETFSALLAFCAGNSPVTWSSLWWRHQLGTFPRYWPWGESNGHRWIPQTKASDAGLWCFLWSASINGWVNNDEAGDLRRHRAHYDVIVMRTSIHKL